MLGVLTAVLLELYPLALACSVGDFEPQLFGLLRKAFKFDAGWVGRVALTGTGPVMHNSFLHGLPSAFASEWERAKLDDPLLKRIGTQLDLALTFSGEKLAMSPAFREIVNRHGLSHALIGMREDRALGLHTFLSLYRRGTDQSFSSRDKRLISLLLPHIASATNLNRVHQMDQIKAKGGEERVSVAICDTLGILQYADDAFADLMRREWDNWAGPKLPMCIVGADAAGEAQRHIGRAVLFDTSALGDLLVIRARSKSVVDALSPREFTVAQLFAHGLSYKEVARRLGLAPSTVRHQLREAYRKLGVQDKGQIASLMSRHLPN